MSGGSFDYKQYQIQEIIDTIERRLIRQGLNKPKDLLFSNDEYYEKNPEERKHETYSHEVQEVLKNAIDLLNKTKIYVNQIDYFFSGDIGEESLIEGLKINLKKYENIRSFDI